MTVKIVTSVKRPVNDLLFLMLNFLKLLDYMFEYIHPYVHTYVHMSIITKPFKKAT